MIQSFYCVRASALLAGLVSAFFWSSVSADPIEPYADRYIDLGLRFQNHDKSAYLFLGDPSLKQAAQADVTSLPELVLQLEDLAAELSALEQTMPEARKRISDLNDRVVAMKVRGNILLGETPNDFEEEVKLTFGVEVPHYDEAHFERLVAELDKVVPGEGPLPARMERFRDEFRIPPERLEAVLSTAIEECRRRTKAHLDLPPDENTRLALVTGAHWVGFTVYMGDSFSVIQLSEDVPIHIERALELGCHEGYPGHHAHASMLEAEVIKSRGWKEYQLIQLLGPIAVMNEGAASYAVDLAFSPQERLAYEREALLPLAGMDSRDLERYYHYIDLVDALNYARTEVARKYLYGGLSFDDSVEWLMRFGLETRGTATQRMHFIEAQRAYVVTYNYGKTLVKNYIEQKAGSNRSRRWDVFRDVILTPMTPRELEAGVAPRANQADR